LSCAACDVKLSSTSPRRIFLTGLATMVSSVALAIASTTFFVAVILGGLLSRYITAISTRWLQCSNAFCGGVILSVALVHMLSENSEALKDVGTAMSKALGGEEDEAVPVGFFLAGFGFLIVLCIERLTGQGCDTDRVVDPQGKQSKSAKDASDVESQPETDTQSQEKMAPFGEGKDNDAELAGVITWVGIMLHSSVEAVATGASRDDASLFVLMSAVLAHKGFAAFAVANGLRYAGKARFWSLMTALALTGPLGIALGAFLTEDLEGHSSAALQCFAAGTLLAIGVDHMLLPSLSALDGPSKHARLLLAFAAFFAMSLLAVWA